MRRKRYLGPLLVAPGLTLIFAILVLPVFFSFYYSLFDVEFLKIIRFAGFSSFVRVLRNRIVIDALGRSLLLSFVSVGVTMVAGFLLASWIDKRSGAASYVVQIIGLIPWVTSLVVGALLWKWVFAGELGLYNYARRLAGLAPVAPLQSAGSAMASLMFVVSWRTIGYSMVMCLAGLKVVPVELVEATKVDGANAIQRLWYLILPMIRTPLLIAAIVVTLSNMNNVTVPLILTGGGPANATNVVSLELYRLGFVYYKFGDASALAFLVFGLNVLLIWVYVRMVGWKV